MSNAFEVIDARRIAEMRAEVEKAYRRLHELRENVRKLIALCDRESADATGPTAKLVYARLAEELRVALGSP